ncbi:DUF397 domain-containing protein [Streptosporangium sp. NBC_01495]|uniref:DUF397 domain-containing protein n=1 Tax=Streptosporangium sp. NBC_01495 TaxID=2903899 RepID=UPI002E334E63|nr:DUF397 domain-containing protein [Streptosporangium sp. NBC_01495]
MWPGHCRERRSPERSKVRPRPKTAVRDSKNPGGPNLLFAPAEWKSFISGVKTGESDSLI